MTREAKCWKSRDPRGDGWAWAITLATSLWLGFGCESADAGAMPPLQRPRPWNVLGAGEGYAGVELEEWVTEWAQWTYAQTDCSPAFDLDEDGSACERYQDPESEVFFLAGGAPGTHRTRCDVPSDKALLVPLHAFMTDNAGVPEAELRTDSELRDRAERVRAATTDLRLVVDGVEVESLERYSIGPVEFSYELPTPTNWFSCNELPNVSGTIAPAFIAGYFVLLPPPPKGSHEIEYAGLAYLDRVSVPNHVELSFESD